MFTQGSRLVLAYKELLHRLRYPLVPKPHPDHDHNGGELAALSAHEVSCLYA